MSRTKVVSRPLLPTLKSSWTQGLEFFTNNLENPSVGCEYPQYATEPVQFGQEILGEDYTDDVRDVMYSVRDNIVTVAKSANAVGKCVAWGEYLPLADGSFVLAEDLLGLGFEVFSVDSELNIKKSWAYATDNGIQPVARLITATGKQVIRTLNHPLRGPAGWHELESLAPGMPLLVVNGLHLTTDYIISIEKIGERPTVAITVPGDETFLTGLVEHNTHSAARLAVWFFKCFPNSQVYTAAAPPEGNLKRLLWGEINGVIRRHPVLFEKDRIITLHIERDPQSFITGVTIPLAGTPEEREAKFSGKHSPHLFFILDEGDAIPAEVYKGIESCMSGGHVRLLVMFNPRRKFGPVYLMETKRQANIVPLSAFRHPNVVTGEDDKFPGAVKQAETVRRINEWSRPLSEAEDPDSQCFEVPEFLVGVVAQSRSGQAYSPLPGGWRRITDPQFSYMVLGDYPSMGVNQLIDEDWINQARSRYDQFIVEHGGPPSLVRPDMGFDPADEGDCENSVCFRYGNFVSPLLVWGGIDVDASADKAADLYRMRQAKSALIDGTGIGAACPAKMRKQLDHTGKKFIKAVKVQVAHRPKRKPADKTLGEFYNERAELWWMVREWLRTEPAMLPPDELLIEELLVPTYDKVGGRVVIMSKRDMKKYLPNRRSPDRAESLILTFAKASIGWAWGMGEGGTT